MTSEIDLSICIPTINRARFIGETLDSIARQINDRVEVVIVDGASTDGTREVVDRYVTKYPQIRYARSDKPGTAPSNQGFDRDCNQAVELARGTYCWLMTDDDLLVEGAIDEVLARVDQGHDLMFATVKVCSVDFAQTVEPRLPKLTHDRNYDRSGWTSFVAEFGQRLTFVGAVIIKRTLWKARERERYFGTGFIHVGVILGAPMNSVVALARPLVMIRLGNALWTSRAFDIWMDHWPNLIWSFDDLSEATKAAVTPRHPFKSLRHLLWYRAVGVYTMDKFSQRLSAQLGTLHRLMAWAIASMPIAVTNALYSAYLLPRRSRPFALQMYALLHCGHAGVLTRGFARLRGIH